MKADGPCPSIGHMLRKGSGSEPHGDAQEDAPGGSCEGLQGHVVEGVQNQYQEAPVQHSSAAQHTGGKACQACKNLYLKLCSAHECST